MPFIFPEIRLCKKSVLLSEKESEQLLKQPGRKGRACMDGDAFMPALAGS